MEPNRGIALRGIHSLLLKPATLHRGCKLSFVQASQSCPAPGEKTEAPGESFSCSRSTISWVAGCPGPYIFPSRLFCNAFWKIPQKTEGLSAT